MNVITVEQLYEQHIKSMPTLEKIQLMTIINQQLAKELASTETVEKPKHSIMELHGLGADIWQGVNAQKYVDGLRNEWDHRP